MILKQVWQRYGTANREYRRILMRAPVEQLADPDSPLSRARREAADALEKYLQAFRELAPLTPEGKPADGPPCQI